mmetsp:Transcript_2672/g.4845  ORF Transcript_2672/g.4845 Transcript_2672/m.4845 type:complete len:109 (-) Transcript_2672:740-1066(-)
MSKDRQGSFPCLEEHPRDGSIGSNTSFSDSKDEEEDQPTDRQTNEQKNNQGKKKTDHERGNEEREWFTQNGTVESGRWRVLDASDGPESIHDPVRFSWFEMDKTSTEI